MSTAKPPLRSLLQLENSSLAINPGLSSARNVPPHLLADCGRVCQFKNPRVPPPRGSRGNAGLDISHALPAVVERRRGLEHPPLLLADRGGKQMSIYWNLPPPPLVGR